MTFKGHMSMHFADMFEIFRLLPTCWCAERKHKVALRWINNIRNTGIAFDVAAFRDVTTKHLHDISSSPQLESRAWIGLLDPTPCPPHIQEVLLAAFGGSAASARASKAARVSDFEITYAGDIIEGAAEAGQSFVGKIVMHVDVATDTFTVLETYTCIQSLISCSIWDTRAPGLTLVRTTDISCACIFKLVGFTLTVLRGGRSPRPE